MCKELTPWEKVVQFHGHVCPGVAIGFRVAVEALNKFKRTYPLNEDGLCLAKHRFCGLDAIQILTGCTIGKGNLVIEEAFKYDFVIAYHRKQRAFKVEVNPEVGIYDDKWKEYNKLFKNNDLSKTEKNEIALKIADLTQQVIDIDDELFFAWEEIDYNEAVTMVQ